MNIISNESREALEAYALGVNAWALSHPLPPEYAALEITKFEPWSALDSLSFANLFLLGQFFDDGDASRTQTLLTYQGTGEAVGFDGTKLFFEDLARFEPFDHTTTLPASAVGGRTAGARVARPTALYARAEAEGRRLARARRRGAHRGLAREGGRGPVLQGGDEPGEGPRLERVGRVREGLGDRQPDDRERPAPLARLAVDVVPDGREGRPDRRDGDGRRGRPVRPRRPDAARRLGGDEQPDGRHGHVRRAARARSHFPGRVRDDVQGQKEPVLALPEVFRAEQPGQRVDDDVTVVPATGAIPPATIIVPRRNLGPIISLDLAHGTAISLQYAGTAATREIDGFRIWNTARSSTDFRRGLTYLTVGSFNWAVADADGNLAYLTSGELPLREDLQANAPKGLPPYFLRDGTGGNEWMPRTNVYPNQALLFEILPPSERPQSVNPAAGWFVNSNNDPVGVTLGNNPLGRQRPGGGILYLNYGYDGFRCAKITQDIKKKLANGGKISFDDMKAIQADNQLLDAQVFVPYILAAWDHASAAGADPALAAFAVNPILSGVIGYLRTWDDSTPTGLTEGWDAGKPSGTAPTQAQIDASVAATFYSVWRGRFAVNVIDKTISRTTCRPRATTRTRRCPACGTCSTTSRPSRASARRAWISSPSPGCSARKTAETP